MNQADGQLDGQISLEPYYQDDWCTIYNARCEDVLPVPGQFDLLLTDPPYGINADQMTLGKGNSSKAKADRFDKSGNWDAAKPSAMLVASLRQSASRQIIWGGNYFTDCLPPTNDWLIWHKQNDGRSFSECEMAWSNLKKQTRHFSWGWLHGGESKVHPTQKPLALMRWCLSQVPDAVTILDPFMGSGTTLLAAKLEGRKAVGIEINEKYCQAAVSRLRQKVMF